MMCNMKSWLVLLIIGVCMVSIVNATPQVPCFFIFGDSLADNGNNNNFQTLAQVNHPPYGIDFPGGATGRFTNGRTTIDILSELLGFEDYIPSFVTAKTTNNIFNGVNYASGSAGILKDTGKHLGENYEFRSQFRNHRLIVSRLGEKLGDGRKTSEYLKKCLYYVGLGSNDYINNYFSPYYPAGKKYTPEEFATELITRYGCQIKKLYQVGARKVALAGIGRIGCTPYSLSTQNKKGGACVEFMNEAVQHFNAKLLTMVDRLNANSTAAKFIYINSYGMGGGDPSAVGFKNWQTGCCPVDSIGQCVMMGTPCKNRSEYVFWDGHHPTELLNMITASRIYNAFDLSDCYPLDVNQLVQWAPHNSNSTPS